jgi:WD40 repeat protein
VCLYCPSSGRIMGVLGGHSQSGVRAVRWLCTPLGDAYGDETELVSGGGDGVVKVWRIGHRVLRGCGVPVEEVAALAGHAGPVCALGTLHLGGGGGDAIVSTGIDCTLRLWHRSGGCAPWGSAVAPVALRSACEAVAVSRLPGMPLYERAHAGHLHALLIAAGCTDCRIHLFATDALPGSSLRLLPLAVLSGHSNWVKSLSFSAHASLGDHFPLVEIGCTPATKPSAQPLFLASASQDGKCRMWRVDFQPPSAAAEEVAIAASPAFCGSETEEGEEEDASGFGTSAPPSSSTSSLKTIVMEGGALTRGLLFRLEDKGSWMVSQDALLSSHEGWVTHVEWAPPVPPTSPSASFCPLVQPFRLLSCSMDKTVIQWSLPSAEREGGGGPPSGAWVPSLHICAQGVVQEGAVKGSSQSIANGSSLGLLCVSGSPCGRFTLAIDHHGALLSWRGTSPLPGLTGHYGTITTLAWAEGGRYLLSGSNDTTCRAWAPLKQQQEQQHPLWVELGRPMLHGWELRALCLESGGEGSAPPHCAGYKNVAIVGSAEKAVRVLSAPLHFREAMGDDELPSTHSALGVVGGGQPASPSGALGGHFEYAYVPELGLSAKGIRVLSGESRAGLPFGGPFFGDAHQLDGKDALPLQREEAARLSGSSAGGTPLTASGAPRFSIVELGRQMAGGAGHGQPVVRPLEHTLVMHTRWAETNKLYGHTGDVACMSLQWPLLASASVARTEKDAAIHLWNAEQGSLLHRLGGHRLSVTALAWGWSQRGGSSVLLSTGRDRAVGVWDALGGACLALFTPHKRQISSLAVAQVGLLSSSSSCCVVFATGSRDGQVRLWALRASASAPGPTGAFSGEVGAQVTAHLPLPTGFIAPGVAGDAPCVRSLELSSLGACTAEEEGVGGGGGAEGGAVTSLSFSTASAPVGAASASAAVAAVPQPHLTLAVGRECGSVSLWEVAWGGGAAAATLTRVQCLGAHVGPVSALAWRPLQQADGRKELASAGADGALKWWRLVNEESIANE